MLKVSQSFVDALGEVRRAGFLRDLAARFRARSPHLAATLTDAQVAENVEAAAREAAAQGFLNRGPIRLWLDMRVAFGSGFLADPVYPWAARAVGDADPDTQSERAERLFAEADRAIDAIHGADDAHTHAALRALLGWATAPHDFSGGALEAHAVGVMEWMHPQKAKHAGEDALRMLHRSAAAACAEHGVFAARPTMLVTALHFAFGAGCLRDPLYPWISATLRDARVADPATRFERLERKAIIWLQAVVNRQSEPT